MENSLVFSNITIELDVYGDVVPWKLPGVEVKPVIWDLDLVAIDDLLLEDSIFVS